MGFLLNRQIDHSIFVHFIWMCGFAVMRGRFFLFHIIDDSKRDMIDKADPHHCGSAYTFSQKYEISSMYHPRQNAFGYYKYIQNYSKMTTMQYDFTTF